MRRLRGALLTAGLLSLFSLPAGAESTEADSLRLVSSPLPDRVSRPRSGGWPIDTVMLHFISNAKESPEDPYQVEDVLDIFREYGVSAHYLVGRDGTVYALVDEVRAAFHGGKGEHALHPDRKNRVNEYSIGIEILAVGSQTDMEGLLTKSEYARVDSSQTGFTREQYTAIRLLLEDIAERHPKLVLDRHHVIGHDEYAPDRKNDPGELFDWSRIGLLPDGAGLAR